jgi:hypothetical protein
LNPTELARDKFNALFAAHDALDIPVSAQKLKLALKTEKAAPKKGKSRRALAMPKHTDHL